MNGISFLGLKSTDSPLRWVLPVVPGLCSGRNSLFGGVGVAAGVAALEAASGRSCVWATTQFLTFCGPGDNLEIDVELSVVGNLVTQGRATLRVGERVVLVIARARNSPFCTYCKAPGMSLDSTSTSLARMAVSAGAAPR